MNKMILLICFSPAAAVGEDDSLSMSAQHWAVSLHQAACVLSLLQGLEGYDGFV